MSSVPPCSWATTALVTEALGTTSVDPAWLATCTDSGNQLAFTKRAAAGYVDDPAASPGPDVTLGAAKWGAMLYRERGGADPSSFTDADGGPGVPVGGELTSIFRLLHVPKANAY